MPSCSGFRAAGVSCDGMREERREAGRREERFFQTLKGFNGRLCELFGDRSCMVFGGSVRQVCLVLGEERDSHLTRRLTVFEAWPWPEKRVHSKYPFSSFLWLNASRNL